MERAKLGDGNVGHTMDTIVKAYRHRDVLFAIFLA
jgi:hypothetical protein